MSNNYEYSGKLLSVESIEKILLSKKSRERSTHKLSTITTFVSDRHIELGGLPSEEDAELLTHRALYFCMEDYGFANRISDELWELPMSGQRIFGFGNEWVYLYYFETDKIKTETRGKSSWQCKIGKAEKEPENRVKSQTSGCPVPPIIALLFRTNDCAALEKVMHACLKLHGKHMPNTQGKEWFNVNPDDIVSIFKIIVNDIKKAFSAA